jgi:hypothetical protein
MRYKIIPFDIFIEIVPTTEVSLIIDFLIDESNLEIWLFRLHLIISKKVKYVHKYTDRSE